MKILLDHNLDRRLKHHVSGHDTFTTFENGWANVENGTLLSLAEENGFDVLLTADSNISNQQNLAGRRISIIIFRALDNRRSTHIEMIDDVLAALNEIEMGVIEEIFHPNFPKTDFG